MKCACVCGCAVSLEASGERTDVWSALCCCSYYAIAISASTIEEFVDAFYADTAKNIDA